MTHRTSIWRDIALLIVSLGFVSAGLWLGLSEGDLSGFAAAAFFGLCAAFFAWSLARRHQIQENAAALEVSVAEYSPMSRNKWVVAGTSGAVAIVFATSAALGTDIGPIFVWLSAAVALFLSAFAVLELADILPRPFLQFEPSGLRLGTRGQEYLVEWENIAGIGIGEINSHDYLGFSVKDETQLLDTVRPHNDDNRGRIAKTIAKNQSMFGLDVVLLATQYGRDIDVAVLLHVIARYLDPSLTQPLQTQFRLTHEIDEA